MATNGQQRPITTNGNAEKHDEQQHGNTKGDLLGADVEQAIGGPKPEDKQRADGKVVLTEDEAEAALAFSLPEWRKWTILVMILLIQTSMNSNASMYGSAVEGLAEKYSVSETDARLGQMIFLIAYAFGCELWAPWSEEIGRWPTQQASLFLVNVWQILSALSPTFGGVLVSRALGGLSTSGGSVTLGVIADMYRPEDTGFQYAVAFVILSSVGGAPVGAIIGGFVGQYRAMEWIFWVLLIMGGIVQAMHFFLVPETNTYVLMDREAKRRRKAGETNIWGPNEVKENRFSAKEVGKIWWRPFLMLFTEPIVIWLSLLSGFADMLVFIFLEAFTPIFKQYGFEPWQTGLCFLASLIAYIISYCTYLPVIHHHNKTRKVDPDKLTPESRLWWLLFRKCTPDHPIDSDMMLTSHSPVAPLLPIGLFGFSWTSFGPDRSHWIGPVLFAGVIGIANYAM
jgi:hypothetical protein